MRSVAKKVALGGVLTSLALVLGYLEHLIPLDFGIYGVKLGLSNLVTVVTLYLMGGTAAITVNFIRILTSSLLFGNTVSLAYSLCGGMLSAAVMIFVRALNKKETISPVGISLCGGITHNVGQLAVAIILVDNIKIAFYLPVLLAAGALTGFAIGAAALPLVKNRHLNKIFRK